MALDTLGGSLLVTLGADCRAALTVSGTKTFTVGITYAVLNNVCVVACPSARRQERNPSARVRRLGDTSSRPALNGR